MRRAVPRSVRPTDEEVPEMFGPQTALHPDTFVPREEGAHVRLGGVVPQRSTPSLANTLPTVDCSVGPPVPTVPDREQREEHFHNVRSLSSSPRPPARTPPCPPRTRTPPVPPRTRTPSGPPRTRTPPAPPRSRTPPVPPRTRTPPVPPRPSQERLPFRPEPGRLCVRPGRETPQVHTEQGCILRS